ncbi:MAG: hypothetical protein AUJ49_05130, partial [Desulfovibrionaceae bacterium CG1_02_65_16]
MFSSLKLSLKLSLGFGALLVLMLISGGVALTALGSLNNNVVQLSANWLPSIRDIGKVDHHAQAVRRNQLHYLGVEDPALRKEAAQGIETAAAEFEKARSSYETLISSPEERAIYDDFVSQWTAYWGLSRQMMDAMEKGDKAHANELNDQALKVFGPAMDDLAKLIDLNTKGGETEAKAAQAVFERGKMLNLTIMLLALVIGVGVAIMLIRSVLAQLGEDPGYLYDISSKIAGGDLDVAFRPQKKEGGVYHVLQGMVATMKSKIAEANQKTAEAAEQARLADIATAEANEAKTKAERAKAEGMMHAATQLEKVVEVLSSASEELSAQIEQSSRGTEVQSQRVGETATAMEEMNATVLEVAKNASQAADSSASARTKAADGEKIVAQVVEGINTMLKMSQDIKEDMGVLGKQAEGIGQVMNVISDIADQTNL